MGIKGSFAFISFPWQSKSVWHKRYSDCNSAAIMLDRTREKKKKEIEIERIEKYFIHPPVGEIQICQVAQKNY